MGSKGRAVASKNYSSEKCRNVLLLNIVCLAGKRIATQKERSENFYQKSFMNENFTNTTQILLRFVDCFCLTKINMASAFPNSSLSPGSKDFLSD